MLRVPNTFSQVYVTDQLQTRPGAPDHLRERLAVRDISKLMVSKPTQVLGLLVDRAMEICGAVAGGISVYEEAGEVFRWQDLRGTLERFTGETTPRNHSPCGIALDEKSAVLVQSPERAYSWLAEKNVSIPECLLVPLYLGGGTEPLGTLWIVSDQVGHFNLGHADTLEQIAAFTGISLQMIRSEQSLKSALERQELLTREMGHRIKNLIAITVAMLRTCAKDASTKEELTATLSSRLHALAAANEIIHSRQNALHACDLSDVLTLVLKPYSQAIAKLDGPKLPIGEQAINNVALIFHEMATNAAKYGALSSRSGTIALTWYKEADQVHLLWEEAGGPPIEAPPHCFGFGTRLVTTSVTALGGTITRLWLREGKKVKISIPLPSLFQ